GLRGCGIYFGLAAGLVDPEHVRDLIPLDGTFTPNPETPSSMTSCSPSSPTCTPTTSPSSAPSTARRGGSN
ncbi:MAG TPA: hypothetical protein PLC19_08925, partial [Marmoricola sp.]|nr:hypothetical protein [Marmoricola sp.]